MAEKQLYKLDEFNGHLPNPKEFPTQGVMVISIEGCSNTFGDGFMLNLEVDDDERCRLEKKIGRTILKTSFAQLIEEAEKNNILLSEPQYVYDGIHIAYMLTAPNIEGWVGIQVKYYRYFRNCYPRCMFYTNGKPLTIIAIKDGEKLVGLCMPVALPKMEVNDEGKAT